MKKILSILGGMAAVMTMSVHAAAQEGHERLYQFSTTDWSFGTARTAAMGGAFTSLGADLSTPMINPAGLGMYQRSEIGLSPSFTTLNTKTEHQPQLFDNYHNNATRNRFAFNNFGAAFNLYSGSGDVTSLTLGMTYNKVMDYNTRTSVKSSSDISMLYLFSDELNYNQLTPGKVDNLAEKGGSYKEYAGAVMAGWSGLVGYTDDGYWTEAVSVNPGADFYSEMLKKSQGSTGQFDLSLGMNFNNRFYLGFGFGFQDIYSKTNMEYHEHPEGNYPTKEYPLDYFVYNSHLKLTGSAWNFKIGTIVRPTDALRIGLAFHTPTYITMNEKYYVGLYNLYIGNEWDSVQSGVFETEYRLRTPMKLLTGASYTFYNMAILTVDYERIWYNQMKFFWQDFGDDDVNINQDVKQHYKASDNLRVGLEALIAPNWFGRVGFAWYGSPYKTSSNKLIRDEKDWKKYDGSRYNYSAGFGYRTGSWGIDLAYIYMDSKQAPEFVYDYYNENDAMWTTSYKTHRQRHLITLSGSLRF